MANDHIGVGRPDLAFAERPGITFRRCLAELFRKVAPERIRDL
jgi:hypothetical protein